MECHVPIDGRACGAGSEELVTRVQILDPTPDAFGGSETPPNFFPPYESPSIIAFSGGDVYAADGVNSQQRPEGSRGSSKICRLRHCDHFASSGFPAHVRSGRAYLD